MTASTAEQWESRYRSGETGWDRGTASPALDRWLQSGVLAPCRILVPGCGRGHEVPHLTELGFDVTAIDIAPSAVSHLEKELAGSGQTAEVMLGDVLDFEPEQPFDAVYEQTCLCALPPEAWPAYEARLHGWLKSGGILAALFMQTGKDGGPPYHCDMSGMRALFDDQRWTWPNPETESSRIPHPTGLHEFAYPLRRR